MLDLSKHPSLKYLLFGNLYFANGVQGSLVFVIIILYFTELGIPISTATMVAGLASIPFVLKFIFGPITDYFIKYGRKPFIIIGGLLGGFCLFPLAFIDPTDALLPFTLILFLSVVGIVFLDISGMAVGNFFLLLVAKYFGFSMTFIVTGCIVFLTMILPLIVKEIKIAKKRPKIAKSAISEFKKKNTILVALFGLVAAMNFGMILFIIPEYMRNALSLDLVQIGLITTLFPIGTVIGAITGGIMSDKYGRKKTLYVFLFGTIIFSALLVTADTWQILAIIYPIIGFLQGGSLFSAIMALFMDVTNPKIGATQFSILTSIGNFGDYSIGIISGTLVVMLGYDRVFLYAAWFIGPSLLLLYFIKEKTDENKD